MQERLQHAGTSTTLNICSIECLQCADHNSIPRYYKMNFMKRLSVRHQWYPVTLKVFVTKVTPVPKIICEQVHSAVNLRIKHTLSSACYARKCKLITIKRFLSASQTEFIWTTATFTVYLETFANFTVLLPSAKVLFANFCSGYRKACGQQPTKGLFATGKSYGWQSMKVLFAKWSTSTNPKVFTHERFRLTTPTYHTHGPLGMQILARTLYCNSFHKQV